MELPKSYQTELTALMPEKVPLLLPENEKGKQQDVF